MRRSRLRPFVARHNSHPVHCCWVRLAPNLWTLQPDHCWSTPTDPLPVNLLDRSKTRLQKMNVWTQHNVYKKRTYRINTTSTKKRTYKINNVSTNEHIQSTSRLQKWMNNINRTSTTQSADSTAWTRFLTVLDYLSWNCVNANQLPNPTFYYMHECQDSFIQCSTSNGFLSQFQFLEFTPLCYEHQTRFNIHRQFQCFDISRGLGDRVKLRLITEKDR